jgi:hypothetical protein
LLRVLFVFIGVLYCLGSGLLFFPYHTPKKSSSNG